MESDPKLIDLTKQTAGIYRRILFADSINSFFPYLEVYFVDKIGVFSEATHFVEGLEMDVTLEENTTESGEQAIKNRYFWSENHQINNDIRGQIQGDLTFFMLSVHRKNDFAMSKSYQGTISSVVEEVISDWKSGSGKLEETTIEETGNSDYWYQDNKTRAHFLQLLAEQALSNNNPDSPFYTFINTQNEFYFATVEEMLQQPHVGKRVKKSAPNSDRKAGVFFIVNDPSDNWNPFGIQKYDIIYSGFPTHQRQYKLKVYSDEEDGTVNVDDVELKDKLTRKSDSKSSVKGKLGVRKDDLDAYEDGSGHMHFGIVDENDEDNLKGFQNHIYKDSVLSYRMNITVPFNYLVAAGKVLRLRIESNDENRAGGLSEEFSGEWLVISSRVLMGNDGRPWTWAQIAKSTITFNNNNNFFSDFL
jgi:hypothetical protein